MNVRDATETDGEALRDIAERSMVASYSLSPTTIERAVREWYGTDSFEEKLGDDDVFLLVGTVDDEPVAFSESTVTDSTGNLLWLHVHPDHRSSGYGEALFEATVDTLEDAGADTVRGHVLEDNVEGNAFYDDQGFRKAGETTVEIDGTDHVENVYVSDGVEELEPVVGPDGEQLFVDHSDVERGSEGSFYAVYVDSDRERRWGSFCGNCENLVTLMSTMGGLQCGECGNVSKPTRWDAAY